MAGLLQQLQGEQQEELGVPEDPKTPAHLTTVRNIPHTGFGKAFFSKYVHFELVQDPTSPTPTICYVGLPSSDCLRERDDTDLAVRNIASEVKRENKSLCPGWPWLGGSSYCHGQLSPWGSSKVLLK